MKNGVVKNRLQPGNYLENCRPVDLYQWLDSAHRLVSACFQPPMVIIYPIDLVTGLITTFFKKTSAHEEPLQIPAFFTFGGLDAVFLQSLQAGGDAGCGG